MASQRIKRRKNQVPMDYFSEICNVILADIYSSRMLLAKKYVLITIRPNILYDCFSNGLGYNFKTISPFKNVI